MNTDFFLAEQASYTVYVHKRPQPKKIDGEAAITHCFVYTNTKQDKNSTKNLCTSWRKFMVE
jgi:hypothetical protein